MEGKIKSTYVDRCKRYREKNAEEYKINDVLRKEQAKLLLKSNKVAHKEHKGRKRERKRLAKHRKNFAINLQCLDQDIWTHFVTQP